MIGKLIGWCLDNRGLTLLLAGVLVAAGVWAAASIKVDAIPDLSDVQVIIKTEYAGQSPEIIEKQVTYPLTTAMLQVPHAKVVRGYSMFGSSFVYIIFDDGTDQYWARSRVLEQLSSISGRLPQGVEPQLGPDATGVGWVYQYVLTTGKYCPDQPHVIYPDDVTTCPVDGKPLVRAQLDLSQLRSLQDWYLRYELTAVQGVSEVASLGGFVKQYQVVVDPVKLLAYNIPLAQISEAVRQSNNDVGGRLVELSENEYMVRGSGYLGALSHSELERIRSSGQDVEPIVTQRVLDDLSRIAVGGDSSGAPIYLRDVANIRIGPDIRDGIADWNGEGETIGGIVVMHAGENARSTIAAVKGKLAELAKGLPLGVAVQTAYDRSDLIDRAVGTLSHTLVEEVIVVALVCILFLLHARSELVAVFVVPAGVLASLLVMHLSGINANIMSLGGIAIAIGVMVDSSIVMVENAHKHLDREEERLHTLKKAGQRAVEMPRVQLIREAAREVGPSLFFSLLIIVVSFLPVFALNGQSGRMFKPLAYTKSFAMASAALLAVTVVPVLMSYFITPRVLPKKWGWRINLVLTLLVILIPAGIIFTMPLGGYESYRLWLAGGWGVFAAMLLVPQKIIHERVNPISRFLQWVYNPCFSAVMRHKYLTLLLAVGLLGATLWPLSKLGSEFMPPLEEGDLLYMPTTDPGISVVKARQLLQQTDAMIKAFPEVQNVMGKAGRADTATDPAPISMFETTITLYRDKARWRQVPVKRWLGDFLPARWAYTYRPITVDELVHGYELVDGKHVAGMNEVLQIPGLTNSWTMPIRTRIDMLSTGIKTPVGVKLMGPDLAVLAELSEKIAQVIRTSEQTGRFTQSAFAEKATGGNYLDIDINRDEIARYGLSIEQIQNVISIAMGGVNATSTVEGLQRYPVNVRYPHELRDNIPMLKQTLVTAPSGAMIPLGQLAGFEIHKGPPMVKSENARLTNWVYIDIAGIDVGRYVDRAKQVVADKVVLPVGYSIAWSGQYEYMAAARANLMVIVPLAFVAIVLLLYLATRSWLRVGIVLLAVPFSLIGAVWMLYFLDYNLSLAVWVGMIALAGLDVETGLVMLLYLDNSYERFKAKGRINNSEDLWHAVHDGAVMRIRPKAMTVATTFMGLVPLLWASGAGADTMRRLAAPMIGGLASSFLLELLIYPILFYIAKRIVLARSEHRTLAAVG